MLENISKSERYFILVSVVFCVIVTVISYYIKIDTPLYLAPIEFGEYHFLVDINKVNALELERLPGVGPALAEEIVRYREIAGGFKTPEELKKVKGIGDRKFEGIKRFIIIGE